MIEKTGASHLRDSPYACRLISSSGSKPSIATGEVSRSGLARAAAFHPNSLRKLGSGDWNPTADTLLKLERLLQRGTADVLVGPERIIDEARNGRMFIPSTTTTTGRMKATSSFPRKWPHRMRSTSWRATAAA